MALPSVDSTTAIKPIAAVTMMPIDASVNPVKVLANSVVLVSLPSLPMSIVSAMPCRFATMMSVTKIVTTRAAIATTSAILILTHVSLVHASQNRKYLRKFRNCRL